MSASAGSFLSAPLRRIPREMASEIGKVRTRGGAGGKRLFYLDFGFAPAGFRLAGADRFLTRDHQLGRPWRDRAECEATLARIQGLVEQGVPVVEAVGRFRRATVRRNLVSARAEEWIADLDREGRAPYTLSQYRSTIRCHFTFWDGLAMSDVTTPAVKDWRRWLEAKGLAPKSVRGIVSTLRAFLGWYTEEIDDRFPMPAFKRIPQERRAPHTLTLAQQGAVLVEIAEPDRGIFLVMARCALRPGEARALRMSDWRSGKGELVVANAMKGTSPDAAMGRTKTGAVARFRAGPELAAWIARYRAAAIGQAPLFPNPRTGKPYTHQGLGLLWNAAVTAAELEPITLYRGTRHSTLTALVEELGPWLLHRYARHAAFSMTESAYLGDRLPEGLSNVPELLEAKCNDSATRASEDESRS